MMTATMPQYVQHPRFGIGRVIRTAEPNMEVDFPGQGRRLIRAGFLVPIEAPPPPPKPAPKVEAAPEPAPAPPPVETGTQVPVKVPKAPKAEDPERKRWRRAAETYGQWLRAQPIEKLTRDERTRLREEREWETENRAAVVQLDAAVGHVHVLRRDMTTLSNEAEREAFRRGTRVYPKGLRVRVFARVGACLLGRTGDGFVLKLKLEWLELVTTSAAQDGLDDIARAIAEDAGA